MKKIFLLLCVIGCTVYGFGQDTDGTKETGFRVGLSFSSFGTNSVFRFNELDGAGSIDGDYFYSIGFSFLKPLNNWLEVEADLEYSRHGILIYPASMPGLISKATKEDFGLIDIPIVLKAHFFKYFFANGGALISLDTNPSMPIDNQFGIGGLMGVGAQYEFKCGAALYVNPYYKIRALVGTESNQQHLDESGIRLGFIYNINKRN